MTIEIETEEQALETYGQLGGDIAIAAESIPEGWVVYNSKGPLALVKDDGQVQLLSDEDWKPIQAKHDGNW